MAFVQVLISVAVRIVALLAEFFGPVAGAIKNHLNVIELVRVAITATLAGGGVLGFLGTFLHSVGLIFPTPQDAALAATVLTGLVEVIRRLSHGKSLPKSATTTS